MTTQRNPILEDVGCPLGCGKADDLVLKGRDRIHELPGEFSIVRCRSCSLMRTNPRPTPESIAYYYPDNYAPYLDTQVKDEGAGSTNPIKDLLRPLVRRIFDFKTASLPRVVPGSMLEIGCASGAFLKEMSVQGWQVQGIEFSSAAAGEAKKYGLKVHSGPLETAPSPDEPFDLIVGWMVLEHLHDPIGCLRKLKEWAKPGAWLVLSVPNANSLEFRLFRDKWYALHLPNHLHHFTPRSLEMTLRTGGWALERVHHQRVLNNLIVSVGYTLQENGFAKAARYLIDFPSRNRRLVYALYPMAWVFGLFGQTGRMTIWARPECRTDTR